MIQHVHVEVVVILYATGHFNAYVALLSQLPSLGYTSKSIADLRNDVYVVTMTHPIDDYARRRRGRTQTTLGGALLKGTISLDECVELISSDRRYKDSVVKELITRTETRSTTGSRCTPVPLSVDRPVEETRLVPHVVTRT